VQTVVNALSLGSLYALFALGIAVIFGVMGLVNFAHGAFITVGAMMAVVLDSSPVVIVVLATLLLPVLVALATERLGFRSIRNADPATLLITSFAIGYMLQNLVLVAMGSLPQGVSVLPGLSEQVEVGSTSITLLSLVTIAITALLLAGLGLFLGRTAVGVRMRAAAEDFEMARCLGVRADGVIALAFAISGVLAGVAALLLLGQTGVFTVDMGIMPVLVGFVASVLGGNGSLLGAVLGGYLLGGLSIVLQVVLPVGVLPYRDAILFGLVLAFMVVRPQGIIVPKTRTVRV
jgi:branched-chain amino acid transport system permease protein